MAPLTFFILTLFFFFFFFIPTKKGVFRRDVARAEKLVSRGGALHERRPLRHRPAIQKLQP